MITSDQLWGAIYEIANEEPHVPQLPQPIVAKLVELRLVEIVDSQRRLTAYGQKAYTVMESGDGEIPELE